MHGLRRKYPSWEGRRATGIRDRLAATFETGRVADFTIDETYRGADPLDAHVHAATVACGAHVLVTCNIADFRWDENTSSYEVMHPDEFLVLVDDCYPALVADTVNRMCGYWIRKRGEADLPRALRSAECPLFADRVHQHLINRM